VGADNAARGVRRGFYPFNAEQTLNIVSELGPLFTMIDVPHVEQLHIFYLARLLDLDFAAGAETLEVRLFSEPEIPWDRIAFRTVATTLRLYFEDRSRGRFGTHTTEITGTSPRPRE